VGKKLWGHRKTTIIDNHEKRMINQLVVAVGVE